MRPLRILVIDENRKDRASLRHLLVRSSFPYVLHEELDYLRALRYFRAGRPDCILFDILGQGALPVEVLKNLNKRMNGNPVPVIVWTGVTLLPLVQAAVQQAGAIGWLRKDRTGPYELERAIRSAVGRAQVRETLRRVAT